MTDDFLALAIGNGSEVSGLSLDELEGVIERGQQTFIEVGRALMEIRDRRLYRETHATFEAYCGERWGWSRSHSYEVMDAAAVAGALSDTSDTPNTFRESRAMLNNLDPDEREQVRKGTASPQVVHKMTEPIRHPKRETPDEHAQVIELVRRQLTDLREQYEIVSYWQPVWDAIDELNKGIK